MLGIFMHLAHRHLMAPPVALSSLAVDLLGTGPTLGCAQDNHRPARPLSFPNTPFARFGLNLFDLRDDSIECGRHQLVHFFRFIALDEIRRIAVTTKELLQLLVTDAR